MIIKPTQPIGPPFFSASHGGGGWEEHLQPAACTEVQRTPQLLTHPLALCSLTLAPSKAPLVFPIHQQWQAQDKATEDRQPASQPLSRDQNDQAVSWVALIIYMQWSMSDTAKDF